MTANEGQPAPVDVLVIVVTHNSSGVITGLLASLPAGLGGVGTWAITIADNASTDRTAAIVAEQAPHARFLLIGWNSGFAAGINAALRASPPFRAVLILNPDVRLSPGCVATMQRRLASPGTGIVVPVLHRGDGSLICSLRRAPTVRSIWTEALLGGRRAGGLDSNGETITDRRAYEHPSVADWASGCALLVSAPCARAVGEWDESFFLYSEETDFCLRAGDAGFRLELEPAAGVIHLEGEAQVSPWLWSLLTLNRVRLFGKHHGRAATVAFWCALVVRELVRLPVSPHLHRAALGSLVRPNRFLARLPAPPAGARPDSVSTLSSRSGTTTGTG